MNLNGLAHVEEDALAELEQVGLVVGQHAVHALVPDGQDERRAARGGGLRHQPAHAPLEADVLLVHVDAALGEDVHPLAGAEPLHAEVQRRLGAHATLYEPTKTAKDDKPFSSDLNDNRVLKPMSVYLSDFRSAPNERIDQLREA